MSSSNRVTAEGILAGPSPSDSLLTDNKEGGEGGKDEAWEPPRWIPSKSRMKSMLSIMLSNQVPGASKYEACLHLAQGFSPEEAVYFGGVLDRLKEMMTARCAMAAMEADPRMAGLLPELVATTQLKLAERSEHEEPQEPKEPEKSEKLEKP